VAFSRRSDLSLQSRWFQANSLHFQDTRQAQHCPSQCGGTITGHADSALLGRVVIIATDCITPAGSLRNFSQGRMISMTVAGEQIFADYSGQFVPTGDGANYAGWVGGVWSCAGAEAFGPRTNMVPTRPQKAKSPACIGLG